MLSRERDGKTVYYRVSIRGRGGGRYSAFGIMPVRCGGEGGKGTEG